MEDYMKKQKINCRVYDCKYCNNECDLCKLDAIEICNCASDETKEATMCDSYKKEN